MSWDRFMTFSFLVGFVGKVSMSFGLFSMSRSLRRKKIRARMMREVYCGRKKYGTVSVARMEEKKI